MKSRRSIKDFLKNLNFEVDERALEKEKEAVCKHLQLLAKTRMCA